MKSVQIRSFSGLYFPVFGLNTEIYSVFSPKTGKYVPEKTLYLDNLHAVGVQDNKWITYVPWILVLCSLATYYVKSGRIWDLHWSIYSYTWTLTLKYLSFRSVTPFCPMFPCYTPRKYQETFNFLLFSGSRKWGHWTEISWFLYSVHIRKYTDQMKYLIQTLHKKNEVFC